MKVNGGRRGFAIGGVGGLHGGTGCSSRDGDKLAQRDFDCKGEERREGWKKEKRLGIKPFRFLWLARTRSDALRPRAQCFFFFFKFEVASAHSRLCVHREASNHFTSLASQSLGHFFSFGYFQTYTPGGASPVC